MGNLDLIFRDHYSALRAAILDGYSLDSVATWIETNTFLKGAPFTFKDHEYQLAILSDRSREKVVRKCSQIGISELAVRATLALVNILDSSTIIYTLPTSKFAATFVKTRIDPVVQQSKFLRRAVSNVNDNTDIKQFNNSFLYVKGTVGTSAAISVPADGVINDEVDFSDAEVMSNYQSRLTHSQHKLKWKFSTPTVDGYGISHEFASSRRYWNFVKCHCCNHRFVPDYFENVRIPHFYGSIREINRDNVHSYNHKLAYLECPKCKGKPSLQPEFREWVCENPSENYEAAGYQIQPFDAPNIISCSDLILAGTKYRRYADFINFSLGLPAEDSESSFTTAELEALFQDGERPGYWSTVMGVDLGMVCHVMVAGVDHLGQMLVVHAEKVPLGRLTERLAEIKLIYRVALTVMDSMPYTETLLAMQRFDQNLYGSVYTTSRDLRPFVLKKDEEDKEKAVLEVRQVNVNKNKALDALMTDIRGGKLFLMRNSMQGEIIQHMQDMKRLKDLTNDKEESFIWKKSSQGNDHFHHTLLYTWVAAQIRGVASHVIHIPRAVAKFEMENPL